MAPPVAYLLSGLPGSGKSTFARHLEDVHGVVRLSVDDLMREEHGGTWRLIVFRVEHHELVRRLAARDPGDGFGPMSADVLDSIARASQEPWHEGEEPAPPDCCFGRVAPRLGRT